MNNDSLMAFRNQGSANHKIATVRLKGKPGNPTGVGARVTIQLKDGSTQTAEVYAGAGYLSQSPSDLSFGLGESGQVTQIEVRWPGGKVSTTKTPTGKQPWVVAQPE